MSEYSDDGAPSGAHGFVAQPHRTLLAMSLPILVSLIAEPLTGLVDTAFVARLGSAPLAAMGVATTLLSTLLWVFNFLGIGTQTEIGSALGQGDARRAGDMAGLALALALALGVVLAALAWPVTGAAAGLLGAEGEAREGASLYLRIRLLGSPAVLITLAAFGALRGLQDMKMPLWIALAVNALNMGLDVLLIFGAGPIPRLELAGAAWASTIAQWLGAAAAWWAIARRLPVRPRLRAQAAARLLAVGRDLFLRTGSLLLFMAIATRAANQLGEEVGAAHQALRQLWMLTAFMLDAYAMTAQSLVSYFLAADQRGRARGVAAVSCAWGAGTGVVLTIAMLAAHDAVALAFVPESARAVFTPAWWVLALAQPANGLSFVTDGIHWGTADYGYLRNAMFAATAVGAVLLLAVAPAASSLTAVWLTTAAWIAIRAGFGVGRVWPGRVGAPLGRAGR